MPLYRFDDQLVLFAHIPKTGGSSLDRALQDMGGLRAFFAERGSDYARCTPQHMHAELLEIFIPDAVVDLRFAVIRHPVIRLISEYKMRRAATRERGEEIEDFGPWVEHVFARYETDPYLHDNHIRPQAAFVTEGTELFRHEEGLVAPVDWLARQLGRLPVALGHMRRSEPDPIRPEKATLDRIAAFYRDDFHRFGYDPARF
jgi:hypothetical protein